nr:hypothetical protein EATA8330_12830 [Enterobacter asburiae]
MSNYADNSHASLALCGFCCAHPLIIGMLQAPRQRKSQPDGVAVICVSKIYYRVSKFYSHLSDCDSKFRMVSLKF